MVEIKKKKHPTFARMNYGRTKRWRIGEAWRRPRGHDNKQKTGIKFAPAVPAIGYRSPRTIRYMHPTGVRPVLVHNITEAKAMAANGAIIIAGGVGWMKRVEIMKVAQEKKLKVLNVKVAQEKK